MLPTIEKRQDAEIKEIDTALADAFGRTLAYVCLGLAVLFAAFFTGHAVALSGSLRLLMTATAAAASLGCLGLWYFLAHVRRTTDDDNWWGAVAAAVPLAYSLLQLAVFQSPYLATNLTLLLIGAGLLFLSPKWFVWIGLLSFAGWLLVALPHLPDREWLHFGYLVLAGGLIGFFVQMFRMGFIRRIREMHARDAERKAHLRIALKVAEDARRAAERTSAALENAVDLAQRNKERFQRLSAATFEAVMIHDGDRILDANQPLLELLGYSFQEIQNADPGLLLAPQSRRFLPGEKKRCRRDSVEVACMRRDGQTFTAEMRSKEITLAGRSAFVAAIRDVSGQKRFELDLIQAREKAEEVANLKSSFLANISHEIRTPMNGVVGMTTLLLDTPLSEQQKEYANIIRTSADSLLTLINDILDYSKIEAGQLELESMPFSLSTCVEEALDLVAFDASRKGLEVAYTVHSSVPEHVAGDVARLRQVLVNLLANAVKFTETGEIIVAVTADQVARGKISIQFSVRDTGIGIPASRMHRLFQSFSQVDASTTRRFGGTGLGLAICKRLTEAMGGSIWVESRENEGSTFHFTVTAEIDSRPTCTETMQLADGMRVFVGYANAAVRDLMVERLESWGCTVSAAAEIRPPEGLPDDPRFDAVIVDAVLLDGEMQHVPELRDLGRHAHVIVLSGIGRQFNRPEDLPLTVLNKPLKPAALLEVLRMGKKQSQKLHASCSGRAPHAALAARFPVRILIADDNEVNMAVTRHMLAGLGYKPTEARTGAEVLDLMSITDYDLMLLDVRMPVMGGLEVARHIHDHIPAADRPYLVALTAEFLNLGMLPPDFERMDECISKPVTVDQLRAVIERAAGRKPVPKRLQVAALPTSEGDGCAGGLLSLAAANPELFAALRHDFRHNARGILDEIEEAAGTGSTAEIEQLLGRLRDAASLAGLDSLNAHFDAVGAACATPTMDTVPDEMAALRRAIQESAGPVESET